MSWVLLALALLSAESKPGAFSGQVRDASSGQPLPGVNVVVLGTELGAATDEIGRYRIQGLPPGEYSVEVSMIGYATKALTRVEAIPGRTVFLDFKLQAQAVGVEGVTVRPSYFSKDPAVTASDVKLTYHEMRTHPEGYNVARTVASLPGVSTGFDFSSDIIVRGGAPDENLTIIDNLPVPYPVHFPAIGGGFGQASIVSVETLDEVGFSPGGYAARYGGKLSSLMDITLRDGNKDRFEASFDLNMSAVGASVEGPIGAKFNYMANYRKSFLEIVDLVSDIGDVVPSYDDIYLRLAYSPSVIHKIWVFGIQTFDRMSVPGGSSGATDPMEFNGNQTIGGANWRMLLGDVGFSTLTMGGTNLRNGISAADSITDETTFSFEPHEIHLYFKEAVTLAPAQGHEIQFGLTGGYSDVRHEYFAIEDTMPDGSVIPTRGDTTEGSWYTGGGYAQYIYSPWSWLRLTPGVRVSYNTLTEEFGVEPRGGIALKPFFSTTLNLSFGIYHQLNDFSTHINHDGLLSKRAIHYIAGIEQMLRDDLKLSLEGYYKQLDNLIFYDETDSSYSNQGTGQAYGLELFVQKKMGKCFHGQASYSLAFSERENPSDGIYDADWDIRHMVTLIGGVKFLKHFETSVKYSYASPKPWTPFDLDDAWLNPETNQWVVSRVEDRNSGRLPAYSRLDFQISHTSYTKRGIAITGFFNLQNVLNHANVLNYGFGEDDNGDLILDPWEQFAFMPVGGVTIKF